MNRMPLRRFIKMNSHPSNWSREAESYTYWLGYVLRHVLNAWTSESIVYGVDRMCPA